MKILVISSEPLVTKKHPLGGIFQYEQSKALAKAGHNVVIISTGYLSIKDFFSGYPYEEYEEYENLEILRCYKYSFIPRRFISPLNLKKLEIQLFKKIVIKYFERSGLPDVVHAHNIIFAGIEAEWIKENYNVPFLITEHSSSFKRGLISPNFDQLIISSLNKSDCLTCVSISFADVLKKRFNYNFDVIYNLVDEIFLSNSLLVKKKLPFIFINAASLDKNKNHKFLIEVFASNFKDLPVILKIAGDGPLKYELINLSKRLFIENQIIFLGKLSRISLCKEMLNANCFVLSSIYETFGVVLIEAMASGLPLIATKSGGPEDIINQNNGILIDQNSSDQLSNAMNYMYLNAHTYDPESLRKEAKDRFGHKSFVDKVTKIYQEIILRNKKLIK
jgi:glycosyltransferase involved in cell wall biosynthesis